LGRQRQTPRIHLNRQDAKDAKDAKNSKQECKMQNMQFKIQNGNGVFDLFVIHGLGGSF
jgi:hypothetical protein